MTCRAETGFSVDFPVSAPKLSVDTSSVHFGKSAYATTCMSAIKLEQGRAVLTRVLAQVLCRDLPRGCKQRQVES